MDERRVESRRHKENALKASFSRQLCWRQIFIVIGTTLALACLATPAAEGRRDFSERVPVGGQVVEDQRISESSLLNIQPSTLSP